MGQDRSSEPLVHQLGSLRERCMDVGFGHIGAFWDLKIASKQCNDVAMKLQCHRLQGVPKNGTLVLFLL